MRFLTHLILCLSLVGCATKPEFLTPLPTDARSLSGRDDIIEAVFRYMCQPEPVESTVSHNVNLVHKVYFLGLGDDQDPSAEFLKRLADLKAPVKPLSAGEWKDTFIYDKTTGERGAALCVRSISMNSRDVCIVHCEIYPGGGLSASGPLYRCLRKNRQWIVVAKGYKWIS